MYKSQIIAILCHNLEDIHVKEIRIYFQHLFVLQGMYNIISKRKNIQVISCRKSGSLIMITSGKT